MVMMKVKLDAQLIQTINYFQNMTGSSVIDCISENSEIYFVVAKGHYGLSVGRGGSKIRNAERALKKSIRIFEYSEQPEEFIKNTIPEAQEIIMKEDSIEVRIKQQDRAKVIGKAGKNIKIINRFLERLYGKGNLKVK
jgi:N utilization substance protein A